MIIDKEIEVIINNSTLKYYNELGKNLLLQYENELKWQAVRDAGDDIEVMIEKSEIKRYVDILTAQEKQVVKTVQIQL